MQNIPQAYSNQSGLPVIVRDPSATAQSPTMLSNGSRQALAPGPGNPRLDIPPASSVYSQDISPPDSPRTGDGGRSASPNVSPITDGGGSISKGQSFGSRTFSSNIPLPSQQAAGGAAAYISGWREKINGAQAAAKTDGRRTKWDTYSGEPTSSEKGKPGNVTPGSTQYDRTGMGHSATITGGQAQSPKQGLFQNTLRKVSARKDSGGPPQREEWKGASGREAIVSPVADKPQARTKALPTPSQRRKQQGLKQNQGLRQALGGRSSPPKESDEGPSSPMQAIASFARRATGSPASPISTSDSPTDTALPTTAEKSSFPSRDDSYQSPDPTVHQSTPLPPRKESHQTQLSQPSPRSTIDSPVSPSAVAAPGAATRPEHSYSEPKANDGHIATAFEKLGIHNEPGSRFSATTYATTIADSPPASPGLQNDQSGTPSASVLNRKRPVPSSAGTVPRKSMARKPTPSEIQLQDVSNKAMPLPPEDAEPVDKVTLLEAKLNSLHKRKANIGTVIQELTNVVQPSPGSYDVASRAEIRKTVNGLTVEQAQIAKEIHDTGLQLHRALKKRDQEGFYEPTGLWVHRVTR